MKYQNVWLRKKNPVKEGEEETFQVFASDEATLRALKIHTDASLSRNEMARILRTDFAATEVEIKRLFAESHIAE